MENKENGFLPYYSLFPAQKIRANVLGGFCLVLFIFCNFLKIEGPWAKLKIQTVQ